MNLIPVIATAHENTWGCFNDTCETERLQGDCHSIIITYHHWTHTQGYSGVSCVDDAQHWACCHEHAVEAAHICIETHVPDFTKSERVTLNPLPKGAKCSMPTCGKLLQDEAYQIAPGYATPGRGYRAIHYTDIMGGECWTCSLEHAKEAAHIIINEIIEQVPHALTSNTTP